MERTGLIPVEAIDQKPLLSNSQKDTLVRMGLRYLQNNRITINPKTVEAVGEVVLDALEKGLRTEGKQFLLEREGVSMLVNKGFAKREEIRQEARKAIENHIGAIELSHQYIGQLAIPAESVSAARQTLNNFTLSAKIEPCEKIVEITNERKEELAALSAVAISQLPEDLARVVKRRELSVEEKARFIRNIITSIVFRSTGNPIISADELLDFNNRNSQNPNVNFNDSQMQQVKGYFDSNNSLLAGLFTQTKQSFNSSSTLSEDSKDLLFNRFRSTLLLLHPALEEVPISVDPNDIDKGDRQTIWDKGLALKFEGFVIPKRDTLRAAVRQAFADRINSHEQLLNSALMAWANYEANRQSYPGRLAQLSLQIAKQKDLVESFESKGYFYPGKEDLRLVNFLVENAQRKANESKYAFKFYKDSVASSRARAYKIAVFKNQVFAWQEFGQHLEIPADMYVEILSKKGRSLTRSITNFEGKLSIQSAAINRLFAFHHNKGLLNEKVRDMLELENRPEGQILNFVNNQVARIDNGRAIEIFDMAKLPSVRDFLRSELKLIIASKVQRKKVGLAYLSDDELKRLKIYLQKDILNPNALRIVAKSTLARIANELNTAVSIRKKLSDLHQNRDQIEQEIRKYRLEDIPVPKSAYKILGQVFDLYNELMVASMPINLRGSRETQARTLSQMGNPDALRAILPMRVDKKTFKNALEKYRVDRKLRRKGQIYFPPEDRLKVASNFLNLIDSSILSLNYAEGIQTSRYLELIARKQSVVHRYFRIPELEKENAAAQENLKWRKHQRDLVEARIGLRNLKQKYHELITQHKPNIVFLNRMRELGLAIPVQAGSQ